MLKLCRICGNHGLLDIYNQCNENSVSLADKINSCLSLQVNIFFVKITTYIVF